MINGTSLKIAVQKKGRLNEPSIGLLKTIGLDFDTTQSSRERLFARCRNFDLDILFLRDDDIPGYVGDGVCDLGIVGLNVVQEEDRQIEEIEKLGFGKCQLTLAAPEGSGLKTLADLRNKRIATTYPALLNNFLNNKKLKATIVSLSGAVEIAPALRVADAICDLVSTGNTLRMNGLRMIEPIFDSEAVLIKTPGKLTAAKQTLIDRLLLRIRGARQAEQTKYIAMNAPETAVEKIKQIVPGLNSPTVVPLERSGMVAVHTVVPESIFWDVIERLKAAGASGILVLPIEKMII